MTGMPIRSEIREVLDAVSRKARECVSASSEFRQHGGQKPYDAPHYVFAPEGCVASTYKAAAEECPECVGMLWDELLELLRVVAHEYDFKRIADAMQILEGDGPFGAELTDQLQIISDELLEIEFRKPGELVRRKGRSRYAGRLIIKGVYVAPDSKTLMIGDADRYKVSAYKDWCIADRILRVVSKGDRGFVIPLTTLEINALHEGCKAFVGKYIERATLPVEERRSNREQWGPFARFKYEKLQDPVTKSVR